MTATKRIFEIAAFGSMEVKTRIRSSGYESVGIERKHEQRVFIVNSCENEIHAVQKVMQKLPCDFELYKIDVKKATTLEVI